MKLITVALFFLFVNAASYGATEQSDDFKGLRAEVMQLRQEVRLQKEEIVRLRALCSNAGIDVNETAVDSNDATKKKPLTTKSNGKFPIVEKPFFGIRLGDSIASVNRKFKTERMEDSQDNVIKQWFVYINSEIGDSYVDVFEGQIYTIYIFLKDDSHENFAAVKKQLIKQYGTPYKDVERGCAFLSNINGIDFGIGLIIGNDETLCIVYSHNVMTESVNAAVEKQKTEKLGNNI
jgi:hypothetical protein